MIIIRLQRRGRKNDPSFRVIVVDSKRAAKSGQYLEMVGSYDPRVDRVDLKADRIVDWMSRGAQVSDTVHNLLVSGKIIDAKKRNVLPKKTVPKPVPTEASGKEEPVIQVVASVVDTTPEETAAESVSAEPTPAGSDEAK